jgi:Zinc knuckle
MGSSISENQFMIQILNNLTSDYELQFAKMERRVGDADKPLTIEEIRGELSLRYERLNMRSTSSREGEGFEETAFFSGQFKGKCRNCGQIGHKSFQCKNRGSHNCGNNSNSSGGNFVCIVVSPAMIGRTVSSSRRRIHDPTMPVQITVTPTDQILTHKM